MSRGVAILLGEMAWDMVHQDLPLLETEVRRMLDESDRAGGPK